MEKDLITLLFDKLYAERDTWGAGKLAKNFQKHGLKTGGEHTIKRAAEVLRVPYITFKQGGNISRSYARPEAEKIINYILTTSPDLRAEEWLNLHPEEQNKRLKNKKQKAAALHELHIQRKKDSPYIGIKEISSLNNLSVKVFVQIAVKLKILSLESLVNYDLETGRGNIGSILKTDAQKVLDYIKENYPEDILIRSRQFALDTIKNRGGYAHINDKIVSSRKNNLIKAKRDLEDKLKIKIYFPSDAAEFVGKNNSTLISGMKLLNLPLYKAYGSYLYDENSLNILKNFFLDKNGLKGQLARAFEQKLRNEHFVFKCEKTYPDLIWKKDVKRYVQPLRFDYYLPEYNLLIEVQGIQHFRPSTMGANISESEMIKNFKELQERDALKRKYCAEHNIPLIEIITKDDFKKFDAFVSDYSKVSNKNNKIV